jgi:hypothetical protein
MEETKLNFINRSEVRDHHNIVIYQPNEASMSHDDIPIAWKVFKQFGKNESQAFSFSSAVEVVIGDSAGNFRSPVQALEGRILEIRHGNLGPELQLFDKTTYNPSEFGVLNALRDGSYNIHCFRNGRLLATKEYLYPKEKTLFRFSESITVGLLPDAQEGLGFDASFLSGIETQFDLSGVGSADIIMTGSSLSDLAFSIENIQRKMFKRHQTLGTPSWWNEADAPVEQSADVPSWWNEDNAPKDPGGGSGGTQSFGVPSWWKEME